MLALRDAVPRRMPLPGPNFAILRRRPLKVGARVIEKVARVRIHFASPCPDAALFRMLAGRLAARAPDRRGAVPRQPDLRQPPTPTPKTSNTGTETAPNNTTCALDISG